MSKPRAPSGLGSKARRLWREVVDTFELMPNELPLLTEVVRCVERLEQLEDVVQEEGVMGADGRPHPALVEARQQQIILGRLLTTLRLPEDWADVSSRPQRRGAARGPYGSRKLGSVS
jgi:hypothetical protein